MKLMLLRLLGTVASIENKVGAFRLGLFCGYMDFEAEE